MKRLLPFVLIALLITACKKGDDATIPTVNQYLTDNYTEDARMILFRLMQSGAITTDKDKPEFNTIELNKIITTLQAVYDLHTPQTDSVFNVIKLHTFHLQSLNTITLQVDKNNAIGQAILAHQSTGNAGFENLLTKYGFTYTGKSIVFSNSAFTAIQSPKSYYIPALLTMFKTYPFIVGAEQSGTVGDASDIEYTLSGNGADINFVNKSGDCPAGCTIRHGWKYRVSLDYKVTYLGRY